MIRSLKTRMVAGAAAVVLAAAGFSISQGRSNPDPDLKLVLNIPASRLDVFEHGKHTHSYDVSAGKREFATPAGKYNVREIIWNPWWRPPASAWARNEKATPPGPYNPMGRIKINFANLLYIHGTQWEDHLGAPASHGCIRMGDADLIELAELIHRYRTPRVKPELLATLKENRTMTRSFPVRPVPFDVVYRLVEVVDNRLVIHPDVYRNAGTDLRKEILSALKRSGHEVTGPIEKRLGQLAKPRKVTRISVPLDSLLAATAGD
ncbi:MAG TPA: L,D-transpeptidase [Longimicrobiales bacterium]